MRIIYCIENISGTGGLQRILIDKMNFLADHTCHEIILMTVWHTDMPLAFSLSKNVKILKLNVALPQLPGGYLFGLPTALSRFNAMMQKFNPDVCVVFRAVGAFLAAFTSWKGRMIYESHLALTHMNHKWIYPLMMKKVDTVVCLTHGDAENFKSAKRIEVIPNYCTLTEELAKRDIHTPNYTCKKVISIGRYSKEKDFPRMRKIWEKVREQHPDWELSIHHTTQDVIYAYLSGSIFIMTSKYEGFPMTLLEAMSCGLPCIAFDCEHGPADIIKDGKNGYLIPSRIDGSKEKADELFAEKLSCLMENQERRAEMGKQAARDIKCFNKPSIMNQWLKLFANQ